MLFDLDTPAACVSLSRLRGNIERFQRIAESQKTRLRPHIKTHRSVDLARMQLATHGAGLAVAKLNEAEALADAGFDDLVVAFPLLGPKKAERFGRLAGRVKRLACVVDSLEGARSLAGAGCKVEAYIKVDTGLHRCGLIPGHPDAVKTAVELFDLDHLSIRGLLTHGGFAYGGDRKPRRAMEQERDLLVGFHYELLGAGLGIPELSLGSTPTVRFFEQGDEEAVTELRPGNYVFMDATQVRLGVAEVKECALTVLAMVVSVRPDGRCILDVGSKVLSSDLGAHGKSPEGEPSYGWLVDEDGNGPPSGRIVRLSEEHAVLQPGSLRLRVGQKVRILPNHACAVAHLAGTLHLHDSDGHVLESWPVMDRGSL